MICVVAMLAFVLTWSPNYDPNPGNGACPAYCEFLAPDNDILFSEYEFPLQHNLLNFAGVVQTVLLVWGYSTTGSFVWPFWRGVHRFFLWTIPSYLFILPKTLDLVAVHIGWSNKAAYRYTEKAFGACRYAWKVTFFPSQWTAISVQVFRGCMA
jgi:hypothetical protein